MIFTVYLDGYTVKCKYWTGEPENGVPADVELLEVSKLYGKRKLPLPYERWGEIDERKLFKRVEELLIAESRESTGDSFNFYNPYSKQYETR